MKRELEEDYPIYLKEVDLPLKDVSFYLVLKEHFKVNGYVMDVLKQISLLVAMDRVQTEQVKLKDIIRSYIFTIEHKVHRNGHIQITNEVKCAVYDTICNVKLEYLYGIVNATELELASGYLNDYTLKHDTPYFTMCQRLSSLSVIMGSPFAMFNKKRSYCGYITFMVEELLELFYIYDWKIQGYNIRLCLPFKSYELTQSYLFLSVKSFIVTLAVRLSKDDHYHDRLFRTFIDQFPIQFNNTLKGFIEEEMKEIIDNRSSDKPLYITDNDIIDEKVTMNNLATILKSIERLTTII